MRLEATVPETRGAAVVKLAEELGLSKSQLIDEALTLFLTAVREARLGRRLMTMAHGAAQPPRYRHADFVEAQDERIALPAERARADLEPFRPAAHLARAALGHRPALAGGAVQRHVDGAVVEGARGTAVARSRVVGREDAADEGDDRQPVPAVVAQRVEVPPRVATVRDLQVEARSPARLAAARRPDTARVARSSSRPPRSPTPGSTSGSPTSGSPASTTRSRSWRG